MIVVDGECQDTLQVRLSGSSSCAGRVEVLHNGQWGHVCSYAWDLPDAEVVCRQLDCGSAISAPHLMHPESLPEDRVLTGVKCRGNETELSQCEATTQEARPCQHEWDGGVICAKSTQAKNMDDTGKHYSEIIPLQRWLDCCEGEKKLQISTLGNACAGRVDVYYKGQWGTVCSTNWRIEEVQLVCKLMGCGEAETVPQMPIPSGDAPIWLDNVHCSGNETFLWECPSNPWGQHECDHSMAATIICKGAVNISLENGGSPCAGRMEITSNIGILTLPDELIDSPLADVVCRQLGCDSAVSIKRKAYFGEEAASLWIFPVHCVGNESLFWQCSSKASLRTELFEDIQSNFAGMVCSAHIQPRLVSSEDPCSGRVEVQFGETWGTICDSSWDIKDANVVCHQLQCGVAVATAVGALYGKGTGPAWNRQFECMGNESILFDCPQSQPRAENCSHSSDMSIICSGRGGPRLVDGSSRCSGRVEVLYGNIWGTLCDKHLDLHTAHVICRHLHCGTAVSILSGEHFGRGTGPVWKRSFLCNGSESDLRKCKMSWDKAPCDHSSDAGIICSDAEWHLQLTDGGSHCDGVVQVMLNGTWVQFLDSDWDLEDASVVCTQLKCGYAIEAQKSSRYVSERGRVLLTNINCAGNESSLQDCSHSVMSESVNVSGSVGVLCSEHHRVRLAGLSSQCAGRVEVYHWATWGTVCDKSWDLVDAKVVCRQLGCGTAVRAAVSAEFGEGSGPVWLDDVNCHNYDFTLWDCPSADWGESKCLHRRDAGVVCSEFKDLRLVSEEYDCAGKLEVFYNGTWGDVCTNGIDSTTVSVICNQLGCGDSGFLKEGKYDGKGRRVKWLDGVTCHGYESVLWECPSSPWGENNCQDGEEAVIKCSGSTKKMVSMTAASVTEECFGTQNRWLPAFGATFLTLGICLCVLSTVLLIKARAIMKQKDHNKDYEVVYEEIEQKLNPEVPENIEFSSNKRNDNDSGNRKIYKDQLYQDEDYEGDEKCDLQEDVKYDDIKEEEEKRNSRFSNSGYEYVDSSDETLIEEQLQLETEYDDTAVEDYINTENKNEYNNVEPFVPAKLEDQLKLEMEYDDTGVENYANTHSYSSLSVIRVCEGSWGASMYRILAFWTILVCVLHMSSALQVRLKGSTQCAGRVQIFYDGQWGHVCSYSWDLPDAEVVCRQLGCGTAVSAPHHIHLQHLPDDRLLTSVKCHGNETELGECDSRTRDQMLCQHVWDAGVICADSTKDEQPSEDKGDIKMRFMSLLSTCTGRVEIYYRGQWGTVCFTGLGMREAHLICNQMNCGEAETLTRFHIPPIDLPIWKDRVRCFGNETFLWECPSDPWGQHDCDHMMDTAVVCKGALNISLENGGSPCAGQMFLRTSELEVSVIDDIMDVSMANVVCTHIGCGSLVSIKKEAYFGIKNVNPWYFPIYCNGNESFLWQCLSAIIPQDKPVKGPKYESAGMVCSAHIKPRLFGDKDPCSGRVEVQFTETWGTFCDSDLDMEDANVVCHQLQCGVAVATSTGVYGEGSGPVWDRQFECKGNESILYDCPQSPPKAVNCTHRRDAGVICSGKGGPRLVGGASRCSGRVEILHDNTWGTLCDKNLDLQAADVICRHLYCGAAVSTPSGAYFGKGKGPIWRDNFQCNGNESRLGECAVSWDKASCDHSNDASIICSDADLQVQLKGGESRCEGTVQVMLNGTWRQILYPEWDVQDASVVCAQLNCGEALKVQNISGYISGSGPVILTDINCAGDELSLQNCSVSVISELFNISGGVGVLCSEHKKVRLAGHSSQCAGRVEVYYNATWGTVSSNSWDLTDAQVVCRQLGCGNAVRTAVSAEFGKSSGPVWIDEVECRGDELALWKCPSLVWQENNYQHKEDAGVVCSEFKELRLVSAEYICAGKLEIFYNGTWGDVCSNRMDSTTVNIICQQLGCGDSGLLEEGKYDGASNKVKWLDGVTCYGHELVLWQCSSLPWGENWCQNGDEARIQCSAATDRPPTTASPERSSMTESAQFEMCTGDQNKWLLPVGATCLILGICLCAVSSALFIKVRANAKKQGYGNNYEAVYEEIEQKANFNLDEKFDSLNEVSTTEYKNFGIPEKKMTKVQPDLDSNYDDTETQDYVNDKEENEEMATAGYDDVELLDSASSEEQLKLEIFYDDVDVEDYANKK
ncbi:deleted in malignant brain tumors 1 protein-like [Erpetoichthys calabaricus]|uniref:deleted in malignant brain tumors 1 protein-like n=1 Tax=Erpetoichthys calabaricus TaxID=27687 RepID=UPI00223423E5|nr:deleted in malignant brain tumors 1 protein-like [Erpetoichthys calabaricus]